MSAPHGLDYSEMPDNSAVLVIKMDGKVFTKGALLEPVKTDEGMTTTLHKLKSLYLAGRRTTWHLIGGRPADNIPSE